MRFLQVKKRSPNYTFLSLEVSSNPDLMSTIDKGTKNSNSHDNAIDNSKKLKWKSFIGKNKREALMEFIQYASTPLLNRIEQSIFSSISESDIPSYFINIPKKLYLVYFLVLDPDYFKVNYVANKSVSLADKIYDSGSQIPLSSVDSAYQLMVAKVGRTSLTLGIESRSKTEIEVSIEYDDHTEFLKFNKNISSHEFMHKVVDTAIENIWLRPDFIMKNIARYLCCEESNKCDEAYGLQYFIVKMESYDSYQSDAFDLEGNLRRYL